MVTSEKSNNYVTRDIKVLRTTIPHKRTKVELSMNSNNSHIRYYGALYALTVVIGVSSWFLPKVFSEILNYLRKSPLTYVTKF